MKVDTLLVAAIVAFLSGFACGYAHGQAGGAGATAKVAMPSTITYQPLMVPVIDGVPALAIGAAPDQATWLVLRSFGPPPTGGFIEFDDRDVNGKWVSNSVINCGTMVGVPPNYQGDCDIGVNVDGALSVVSVSGRWQGGPPGIGFNTQGLMVFGNGSFAPASIAAKQEACPNSVPGNPAFCIFNSGGYTPVYK